MSRKFFVGGNWKMNGDKVMVENLLHTLGSAQLPDNVGMVEVYFIVVPYLDIVCGAPFIYLTEALSKAPPKVKIAAQNCYKTAKGAFTGEIRCVVLLSASQFVDNAVQQCYVT